MPKRKTQNKRAGKKQRRRTSMRQRGGLVIYTLTFKNINNGQINRHRGINLKELIDENISSPENYMFRKGTQNHYSAFPITYIHQSYNANGPTINTWNQMKNNHYEEEYRREGYMPYDEIIKQ
jgi:hypothetical protein